jgi:uncharacterized protein (DUF433 family)
LLYEPVAPAFPTRMSLLDGGIYTIPQAARLLDVSTAKLRFWVSGKRSMHGLPIIQSEHAPIDHQIALSFVNLIEIKFINAFSKYGVSVRSIRHMAEEAKRVLSHPHPFATDVVFRTDTRRILIETTAQETGDKCLYDLKGKNWGLYEVLVAGLKDDIIFGPSGVASAWYPRRRSAPHVLVHPKVAFGQPVLTQTAVPTEAIYDAWTAENEDVEGVARWFEVPTKRVVEAVNFQARLLNTRH